MIRRPTRSTLTDTLFPYTTLFRSMGDRLDRLRLQPGVCGHHQDDDVGDVRTALAHFGEGFVTRRIEEGDRAAVLRRHLIGADMLGDATGFARHQIEIGRASCRERVCQYV